MKAAEELLQEQVAENANKEHDDALIKIDTWLNDEAKYSSTEICERAALLTEIEFADRRTRIIKKLTWKAPIFDKEIAKRRANIKTTSPAVDEKPQILWGSGQLSKATRVAEKILCSVPGKYLECAGHLVTPQEARYLPENEFIERDQDSVLVADASPESILRDLDDRAKFVVAHDRNGTIYYSKIEPPYSIYRHIADRVKSEINQVPYPHLDMLVNVPVLLPDGTVHDAPGELRQSVLLLAPRREYPRISVQPSRQDALDALKKFESLFSGFPFVGADQDGKPLLWNQTPAYSVVLAGCLTIAARSALTIAVPVFTVRAPDKRTGKTRIVDASTLAITGCKPTKIHYRHEEEFDKILLPIMLQQDRVVLIDNVAVPLRSSKLAPLITDNYLSDRILCKSEVRDVYNRSVIFATGNNLTLTGDMAVRALQVKIDANMEHPEIRKFNFVPEDRARERHAELVTAALTVLRAYVLAGKPWGLKRAPWGGLEKWDGLISGCLDWLGYADPYVTRLDVLNDDPEQEAGDNLLETWFGEFGSDSVTLAEINDQTNRAGNKTRDLLLDKDGKWNPRDIGWQIRRLRDRVQNGLKLVKIGEKYWSVIRVSGKKPGNVPAAKGDLPF